MTKDYVTASELASYVYCECCWMDDLEGKGILTAAMEEGTSAHERSNIFYRLMLLIKRIAILLLAAGILLLIIYLVTTYFL